MKSSKVSRGLRNNNPGNIRISTVKYLGEITPSSDKSFKQFETMAYGYRAIFVLLYTYQKRYRLNTIRQMISRYAPTEDNNNTDAYIKAVADGAGISPDSVIDTQTDIMIPIVSVISRVENGVPANMDEVKEGWELFKKHKP